MPRSRRSGRIGTPLDPASNGMIIIGGKLTGGLWTVTDLGS